MTRSTALGAAMQKNYVPGRITALIRVSACLIFLVGTSIATSQTAPHVLDCSDNDYTIQPPGIIAEACGEQPENPCPQGNRACYAASEAHQQCRIKFYQQEIARNKHNQMVNKCSGKRGQADRKPPTRGTAPISGSANANRPDDKLPTRPRISDEVLSAAKKDAGQTAAKEKLESQVRLKTRAEIVAQEKRELEAERKQLAHDLAVQEQRKAEIRAQIARESAPSIMGPQPDEAMMGVMQGLISGFGNSRTVPRYAAPTPTYRASPTYRPAAPSRTSSGSRTNCGPGPGTCAIRD